jgi:hypothetical protein
VRRRGRGQQVERRVSVTVTDQPSGSCTVVEGRETRGRTASGQAARPARPSVRELMFPRNSGRIASRSSRHWKLPAPGAHHHHGREGRPFGSTIETEMPSVRGSVDPVEAAGQERRAACWSAAAPPPPPPPQAEEKQQSANPRRNACRYPRPPVAPVYPGRNRHPAAGGAGDAGDRGCESWKASERIGRERGRCARRSRARPPSRPRRRAPPRTRHGTRGATAP